jgi:hypothetical protein
MVCLGETIALSETVVVFCSVLFIKASLAAIYYPDQLPVVLIG